MGFDLLLGTLFKLALTPLLGFIFLASIISVFVETELEFSNFLPRRGALIECISIVG
jgi:hypothetical protein